MQRLSQYRPTVPQMRVIKEMREDLPNLIPAQNIMEGKCTVLDTSLELKLEEAGGIESVLCHLEGLLCWVYQLQPWDQQCGVSKPVKFALICHG